jgi:hypothetical protein
MESGGSRSEYRGESVTEAIEAPRHELPAADDDVVLEVEVLDDDEDNWPIPEASEPEPQPNPFAPTPPPEAAMMPFDAAVSAAAVMQRNAVSREAIRQ